MLMSLKCGGVGLNLTKANHVVSWQWRRLSARLSALSLFVLL